MEEKARNQVGNIYVNLYDVLKVIDFLSEGEKNHSKIKAYNKIKKNLLFCDAVQLDEDNKTVIKNSWDKADEIIVEAEVIENDGDEE